MTEKTRISLPTDLATRDATVSHDGLLQNLYEENTPIGPMIVKRPGLTNNIALGACVAQGSTFFNNNNYFICSNTLYVNPTALNPPTCPVPGSASTFGNGNVNYFAALDPVTGFLWAGQTANIHKLAVYNPTTGALVTEISVGVAGADIVGVFYNPSTRVMVAVGTNTFGNPNFFVFNPDTYAILQSLVTGTGAGWQGQTVCLDNAASKWVIYNENALGGGGNYSVDMITFAVSGANPYPIAGDPIFDFVYASDIPVFVVMGQSTFHLIADFAGVKSKTDVTVASSGSITPTTYDPTRKNFWYVETDTNKLFSININGTLIGNPVLLTILPSQIRQIVYDQSRDVLWGTFADGNVRKISPSTGAILATLPGADTFSAPQGAGQRLFLIGGCTLIQNTARPGASFNKIGIQ